jgi:hypothetical protein
LGDAEGQDSLIDPEDDGYCDADCRPQGMRASVMPCVNAAPVLEFSKHVLDFVPLAVEGGIVRYRELAI